LNQRDFEELYNDYTQMMLFASSNRLKIENIKIEIDEIHEIYLELIKESPENLLGSLKNLKVAITSIEDNVEVFLFKYHKIKEMIRHIDVIISDYYNIETEISLYELNGMEKDLFEVKDEYEGIKALKLNIGMIKKDIDENIFKLSY